MLGRDLYRAVRRAFAAFRGAGGAEAFSVDTDAREYEIALKALCYEAWNGEIDQAEFEQRHRSLLGVFGLALLVSGLLNSGVEVADLDRAVEELQDYLNGWVSGQAEHLAGFAQAVIQARDDYAIRRQVLKRLRLWVDALRGFANIAGAMQRPDEMLTFGGSDGRESCPDCQRMKGVTQPASWWILNNLVPGIPGAPGYECGGWQCGHALYNERGEQRLP